MKSIVHTISLAMLTYLDIMIIILHCILSCRPTPHSCFSVCGCSGSQYHFSDSVGRRSDSAGKDEEKEVEKTRKTTNGKNVKMQTTSSNQQGAVFAHTELFT